MECPVCHHTEMNLVCIEKVRVFYPIVNDCEDVSRGEMGEALETTDSYIQCLKCYEEFGYHRDNEGKLLSAYNDMY